MPREEASTFQFIVCSIWKPAEAIQISGWKYIFQVEWLLANSYPTPVGIPYFSVATRRSVLDVLQLLPREREPRAFFWTFFVAGLALSRVFPFVMALRDPCLRLHFFPFPLTRWWDIRER